MWMMQPSILLLPGIQLKAPWGLTFALESKSLRVALNFAKAKGIPTLLRIIFLKRRCHETFCHRFFASAWVVQSRTQLQCRLCDSLVKCNLFQSCRQEQCNHNFHSNLFDSLTGYDFELHRTWHRYRLLPLHPWDSSGTDARVCLASGRKRCQSVFLFVSCRKLWSPGVGSSSERWQGKVKVEGATAGLNKFRWLIVRLTCATIGNSVLGSLNMTGNEQSEKVTVWI